MQIEGQTIRANEQLNRKREKVNRKYSQPVNRGRQLSPGFLDDALDEVCFILHDELTNSMIKFAKRFALSYVLE